MSDPISIKTGIVEGKNGQYFYDVDGDDKYDADKDKIQVSEDLQEVLERLQESGARIAGQSLETLLDSIDTRMIRGDEAEVIERLETLTDSLDGIKDKIEELKDKLTELRTDTTDEGKKKVEEAEAKLELLQKQKSKIMSEAKKLARKVDTEELNTSERRRLNNVKRQLGLRADRDSNSRAATSDNSGRSSNARAAAQPRATGGWAPPGGFNYGWNVGSGTGGFNMDAYLNSVYMDQSMFESWDQVGQNKSQQQKMMMLFFYFANMAMSGDMGAMYRFMQFVTYIISKDKALQNVHMASKLIEMENSSRAALEELLNAPTPDGQDQTASFEFTKIMERTKAHQSSIATSQKLIAQMMEEMAQVVETLTAATKSALDANGRILQRLGRG